MSCARIVTDRRVAEFVGERVGSQIFPPFTCIGTEKDGEIVNGVVLNCYTRQAIHATVAGEGWSKDFLALVGHYVFSKLRCERITAITEQVKVVRLAERLGGKVEGLLRNQFGPGRDGFIVGILRDEWKYGKARKLSH